MTVLSMKKGLPEDPSPCDLRTDLLVHFRSIHPQNGIAKRIAAVDAAVTIEKDFFPLRFKYRTPARPLPGSVRRRTLPTLLYTAS